MNPTIDPNACSTADMTRRSLLGRLAALASALAANAFRPLLSNVASPQQGHAIVSFHLDRPYLDWSGTAIPYHPPLGARSGQAAAHLTEEMFRRTYLCT